MNSRSKFPPALRVPRLALLWIAAIAGAAIWLARPAPKYVPPEGWRYWAEPGAVLDILDTGTEVITAGHQGLFRISAKDSTTPFKIPGFSVPPTVFCLTKDQNGRLWVGHQSGIAIQDGKSWSLIKNLADHVLKDVRAIQIDPNGAVWIGSDGALLRISSAPKAYTVGNNAESQVVLENVKIMALLLDAKGGLWIGTTKGLYHLDGDMQQQWGTKNGLPNPQVSALMQDRDGRIWVGTGFHDRGGTVIFEKGAKDWTIRQAVSPDLLAAPKTRSLFQDAFGRIWLGSETAGLSIVRQNRSLNKITRDNGLPGREVTVMKQAADGGIWLGTLKGLVHTQLPSD